MSSRAIFRAEQFTPTQFSSAADKARFANHLVRFIKADFPKSLFPKWFYTRLSMTFGHIANFNEYGFFTTFFVDDKGKRRFMDMTKHHSCFGDPTHTFCDVEKAVQKWLRENGY